jgi:hypothetical protein
LVTISRLKDAHQRLDMKTVRDNNHFGDRPLEPVNTEESGGAQDGQSVKRMVPKITITGENLKRLHQRSDLPVRVLLAQRFLHRFNQIPKADRVLQILRMVSMRGLVKRQTGRLVRDQKAGGVIIGE